MFGRSISFCLFPSALLVLVTLHSRHTNEHCLLRLRVCFFGKRPDKVGPHVDVNVNVLVCFAFVLSQEVPVKHVVVNKVVEESVQEGYVQRLSKGQAAGVEQLEQVTLFK